MNAGMRVTCVSFGLAFLLHGSVQAAAALTTADDLKSALHDVLSHNSLFDPPFLSEKLGLGLRISNPETDADKGFSRTIGVATTNPPLLLGRIDYYVDADGPRQRSTAHLSFSVRGYVPLRAWSGEWHVPSSSGVSTDGGPAYDSLVWPGTEGIQLTVLYDRDGSRVDLSQRVDRVVTLHASPAGTRVAPSELSAQIASILESDLRDFRHVGRILRAGFEMPEDAQRDGLLYFGAPVESRVITGFMPYVFYYGNDKGWYMPPSFIARPLHIADRTVDLSLIPDSTVICLSRPQLAADLKSSSPGIRTQHSKDRDEAVYVKRGINEVNASVRFESGCASRVNFHQVTDVAHSLGEPIMFMPDSSLDPLTDSLTADARRRIHLLARRVRGLTLAGIEITENPGKRPLPGVASALGRLKQLIQEQLRNSGMHAPVGPNSDFSCSGHAEDDAPNVCVDVWQ